MATRTATGRASTPAGRASIGAATLRRDRWWLQPLVTVAVLGAFVVYGTVVAFIGRDYYADPYLSPFYSPCIAKACHPATWALVGRWWPLSPALLILPIPLGFRLTCYYYRKAYYRAFWVSPPACAVGEPRAKYSGETRFPLIMQNVHRYFFYAALIVALVLSYDTVIAFHGRAGGVGVGLGTILMVVNVLLIWAYTVSCHSCRHLMGGRLNHFSKHPVRYWMWTKITWLNGRHMLLAWSSLISVAVVDLYVMLVAGGVFPDPRLFN
jgi:hypothetical protein